MATYDRLDQDGLLYYTKGLVAKIKANVSPGDLKDGDTYATKDYVGTNGGKIDVIKVNGTAQTITDKAVDITVPTNNNALTNGAGYQTASDVTTAINTAIGKITSFEYEIVTALPTTGVKGKIYLIADTHSDSNDSYDEYLWVTVKGSDNTETSAFEKIGNTDVDLSGYVKASEMTAITNAQIDTLLTSAFSA